MAAALTAGSPMAHAQGFFQSATPQITVRSNGQVEVQQHGVTVTTPGPTKPGLPDVKSEGNGKVIDQAVTDINNAAHLPEKLADDAIKSIESAATKAITSIVENVKKKINDQIEQWKKDAVPYLYMAAGIFLVILLIPALIASLITAWIVRRAGRKRALKQELALQQALMVIHAYAKNAGVTVAI